MLSMRELMTLPLQEAYRRIEAEYRQFPALRAKTRRDLDEAHSQLRCDQMFTEAERQNANAAPASEQDGDPFAWADRAKSAAEPRKRAPVLQADFDDRTNIFGVVSPAPQSREKNTVTDAEPVDPQQSKIDSLFRKL